MASHEHATRTALVGGVSHRALDPKTVGDAVGKSAATVKSWAQKADKDTGPYPDMVCYRPRPGQQSWLIDLDWLKNRFPTQFADPSRADTAADLNGEVESLLAKLEATAEERDFYKAYAPASASPEEELAEALALAEARRHECETLRSKLKQRTIMVSDLASENAGLLAEIESLQASIE